MEKSDSSPSSDKLDSGRRTDDRITQYCGFPAVGMSRGTVVLYNPKVEIGADEKIRPSRGVLAQTRPFVGL